MKVACIGTELMGRPMAETLLAAASCRLHAGQ
jgi:3-hydroxyisobutyrate dehydrogenase-like beta-hydroxyacid dehydrogenase